MQSICMAVPILAGKTEAVRAMFKTIKNEKWKEYDKSQKKAGIEKERDFLQVTPMDDMVLMYIKSKDIQKVFMTFAVSKDPFDIWVKEEIKKSTGIDFNQPSSSPLPELLISYDQTVKVQADAIQRKFKSLGRDFFLYSLVFRYAKAEWQLKKL